MANQIKSKLNSTYEERVKKINDRHTEALNKFWQPIVDGIYSSLEKDSRTKITPCHAEEKSNEGNLI